MNIIWIKLLFFFLNLKTIYVKYETGTYFQYIAD